MKTPANPSAATPAPDHEGAARITSPGADTPTALIDTSKMSPEERAALEMTEAAREKSAGRRSFAASLFMGRPDFEPIAPFPAQSLEDEDQGDAFLARLGAFLEGHVDADAIDRSGEIPSSVVEGLAEMGAFGIKTPTRYGGLGLSQTNYSRAAMLLGGHCGSLTALLSAHQSIGVPQPLIVFGTEEQKKKFLPRCASGEISAFALTEPEVGSDPARMATTAVPTPDGKEFIINGEKLWCTNGVKAGVIVVMARTPAPAEKGGGLADGPISAFIVEMDSPGIEVTHRCRFMGLKALYNGVVKLSDVRVPAENLILGEGRGLKVALTTLNTGRITLPAACAGMAKRCLEWSREWAGRRVQWGAPIGRHDAIAQKLAKIAADTFAMESMVLYTSALVDRDKKADIRIEAAFSKMWGTERAWEIVDDTMQIRGGRGYETADSLRSRGEDPVPVERFLRDARINTIFEGSSEVMRLFIAREALDPHLQIGGAVLNTTLPMSVRLKAAWKSALFYARWYPSQWLPDLAAGREARRFDPQLRREMRRVRATSRRLARRLFHAMLRHGPKLEKKQALLGRFVDIGAELFAITATCSRAQHLLDTGEAKDRDELLGLVRYFARSARGRIDESFRGLRSNADADGYAVARRLIGDEGK